MTTSLASYTPVPNTPTPSSSDSSLSIYLYSILGVVGALLIIMAVQAFFQDNKIVAESVVLIRQKAVEMIAEGVKLLYDREPAGDNKACLLICAGLEEINNISRILVKNERNFYFSCCSQDDIFDAKLNDRIKGKSALEKLNIVLREFDDNRKEYIKEIVCESIRTALNFRSETAGTRAFPPNEIQRDVPMPNVVTD